MFNASFNYEIKSLGLYVYFIIQRVRDTFCFLVRFLILECLQRCMMLSIDLGVRQAVIRPKPNYTCDLSLIMQFVTYNIN